MKWFGWLLKGLKDISNRNTSQLFWLTLVLVNKGLSVSGLALSSKLNFTLHPSTYQEKYSLQIKNTISFQEHEIRHNSHVWWIDNYNKSYGQAFYRMTIGAVQQLNWTGWAASISSGFSLKKLQLHRSINGELYPILPDHFITYENRIFLKDIINQFWHCENGLSSQLTKSFCLVHNITCVPLRPTTTGPGVFKEDLNRLDLHLDGLTNFRPMSLFKENVASEKGMATVLLHLQTFYQESLGKHYLTSKTDVNIFWRLYQVLFSFKDSRIF